jgi:hypothetical protein
MQNATIIWPWTPMIKILQAPCRLPEYIMRAYMFAAVRAAAEVGLIQKPSVIGDEDSWKAKIKHGNYIYIYSDDVKEPSVITAVRKDIKWTEYGGSHSPERIGIDINSLLIINIYHHRD